MGAARSSSEGINVTKQTDLFSYLLVFTLFTGLYDTATADDAAQVIRITLKD